MGVSMTDVAKAIGADADLVAAEQARIEARAKLYNCETDELRFDTVDGAITRNIRSMRMGKRIPEDWAALLWTENAQVRAGEEGSPEQDYLDTVLGRQHAAIIGDAIERSFGLGTAAIDPLFDLTQTRWGFVKQSGIIPRLDITDAYGIIPLAYDKNGVSEVALVSYGKDTVSVREYRDGVIHNRAFTVPGSSLSETALPDHLPEELPVAMRCFALVRPAIASSWTVGHPYGVSVLDSARDHIEACDLYFDNMIEDVRLGRKVVFIPETMMPKGEDGKLRPPDKTRSRMYLATRDPMGEGGKIHEHNPDMRVEQNRAGINTALSLASASVGFGYGYYAFDGQDGVKTATEVVSNNSDLYRMRKKHFLGLSSALTDLARAVLYIGAEFGGQRLDPTVDICVTADDSVIEDDTARRAGGRELYKDGLISKAKFLRDYMHYTDEQVAAEMESSALAIPGLV